MVLIVFFLLTLFSCNLDSPKDESLVIVTWNVENLFDDRLDGTEYPEFDPSQGRWDTAQMLSSLDRIGTALAAVADDTHIFCLQEVESSFVLDLLRSRYLPGFSYQFFVKDKDSPIGNALLSRIPLEHRGMVDIPSVNQGLRPILEAHFLVPYLGRIVLFNNHWKSARGGREATVPLRLRSAQSLGIRSESLQSSGALLVATGDFNEDREGENGLTLLEDFQWTLTPQEGPPLGSYLYQGQWSQLDHFLVKSPQGDRLDSFLCYTLRGIPFTDSRGFPSSSDHLPVRLEIFPPLQK